MTIAELLDHPDPYSLPVGELLAPFMPNVKGIEAKPGYAAWCKPCKRSLTHRTKAGMRALEASHRAEHHLTDAEDLPA